MIGERWCECRGLREIESAEGAEEMRAEVGDGGGCMAGGREQKSQVKGG